MFPETPACIKPPLSLLNGALECRFHANALLKGDTTYEVMAKNLLKRKDVLLSFDPLFWSRIEFLQSSVTSVLREQCFAAFLALLPQPGTLCDDTKEAYEVVSGAISLGIDLLVLKCAVSYCGWNVQQAIDLARSMVRDVLVANTADLTRGNVGSASAFHKAVLSQMANLCIAKKAVAKVGVGSISFAYIYGKEAADLLVQSLQQKLQQDDVPPTMEDVKVLRQFRWILTAKDEEVVDHAAVVMGKRRCLDHGRALALTIGAIGGVGSKAGGKRPKPALAPSGSAESFTGKVLAGESVAKAGVPASKGTAVASTPSPVLTQQSLLALFSR
jgi:hypothetical protein